MKTALWTPVALTMLALAGCVEDEPPLTEDDCRVQGLILDPAVEQVDNETGETFVGPACVEDVPTVTASMSGLPETSTAHTPIELTWTMHTTLEADHSHNNGIRVSTASDPAYLGKVDGYGEAILGGKEEHRNFVEGDSSTVTWTPDEARTYYLRVYAVSSWGNYWGPEHSIEVASVEPTGHVETVVLSGGGLLQATSVDPSELDIALGDAVEWTSSDPGVTWTVYRSQGPDGVEPWQPYVVGSSDAIVFKAPGQYRYTAIATDPAGEEIGRSEGNIINVAFPE